MKERYDNFLDSNHLHSLYLLQFPNHKHDFKAIVAYTHCIIFNKLHSDFAMACKSIAQSKLIRNYDVFVSFRGKDTRHGFTDHLFAALYKKGILTFRDDKKLKKGEAIGPELLQAIEGSHVFIVVFSKNYASSTWCLRELAKIVDCLKGSSTKHVLPVFYDVDPSEVRKQSGDYEKAFVEHEERFKQDVDMLQTWKAALTHVANLSGWDVRDKPQSAEIEKIVKETISMLDYKFSSVPNDLVGWHSPIEELEKLLLLGSDDDVRVVGICGMGGIGKSTLATVLYDRISHQYDARCFIDDLSKIYRTYGAIGVQKQFLCQALNEENLESYNLYEVTYLIRTRFRHIKALIVLDNVDKVEELEELAVQPEWLGAGSRIIMISRDGHILRKHGVDGVYHVQLLNWDNSLQLFRRNAFKCDDIMGGYEELTREVLRYANGLPLAIKILGSFLFGRNVFVWKSALARLKENPNKDIMDVLRISYDGLEDLEKEIFLDIACFFSSYEELYVKKVLDCCGLHAEIGIRVLIDKSLITSSHGFILMHNLLRELGRKIVQDISPKDPGKWSRLWHLKDLCCVTESKNNEAVVLGISAETETLTVDAAVLSKMTRLRLLILRDVNLLGSISFLSNELQYLEWVHYPFTYLPSSFLPNKLVQLILPDNSIKQLWEDIKFLPSLRAIDLRYSKNLTKMPDFTGLPNLEWLILEGCKKLVQIHPSISLLRKLIFLNLRNCINLESLPKNILGLSSLEYLNLTGCSKVFVNQLLDKPRHEEHLKKIDIKETAMQFQSAVSIFKRLKLPFHCRTHKESAVCLLPSLPSFSCLHDLDLSFCNLSQIPDAIGCMYCLETLNLGGNCFVRLPSSINKLSKLIHLNLEHCKELNHFPEIPSPTALPIIRGNYSFAKYHRGLCIFNCPKFSEIEYCHSMTFAWMIQVLQVSQESSTPIGWIDIVIPGSQIPRWFFNQNVSTSISIDPSPILHDINWIGIAFSVVFELLIDPTSHLSGGTQSLRIIFLTKQGSNSLSIPVLLHRDLVTVESCHLWVLYLTRDELFSYFKIEEMLDLYSMKMETRATHTLGFQVEVKGCGYRWVFKEDLKQLNPAMMHRGSSSSVQIDDDLVKRGSMLSLEAGN